MAAAHRDSAITLSYDVGTREITFRGTLSLSSGKYL